MTRTIPLVGVLCALVLLAYASAAAHPGHEHTVMGTVKSIKDGHLEVETKDGKVSTFMLADSTKILRGKTKAAAADIKVGERVVAIGTVPKAPAGSHAEAGHGTPGMMVAKEIRLAAAGTPSGSD